MQILYIKRIFYGSMGSDREEFSCKHAMSMVKRRRDGENSFSKDRG